MQDKYNLLLTNVLRWTSILILIIVGFWHGSIIFKAYPPDFREASAIQTTSLLLEGINPWGEDAQPLSVNVYGFVYHIFTVLFALIFGNSIIVHRFISGIFILGSAWIVRKYCLKSGLSEAVSTISFGVFWLSQLYFISPNAKPDSTGLFFFLWAFYLAKYGKREDFQITFCVILSVFAIFAKPYFGLILPIIFFMFAIEKKWKQTIYFTFLSTITLLGASVIIHNIAPYYFLNTLFIHISVATYNMGYAILQLKKFLLFYGMLLLVGLPNLFHNIQKKELPIYLKKSEFWITLCITFFVIRFMAGHNGNYMTYLLQLILPFYLFTIVSSFSNYDRLIGILLILSFISISYDMFQFSPNRIEDETSTIEGLVKKHDKILSSPILANFILAKEKKIYNNGQTLYFKDSKLSNTLLIPYFKSESELKEKWSHYVDDIKQKVETGYFTCITSHNEIYNKVPPINLYELTDTIKIARHGGIWKIRVYERIK